MAMHRPVLFGALLLMVCATGAQQKGVKETGLPRSTPASGKTDIYALLRCLSRR